MLLGRRASEAARGARVGMVVMPPTIDHAADARRLAERAATHAAWVVEDLDSGDVDRAEANAVAAIGALAEARELIGAMAMGRVRVAKLIGA